MQFRQQLYIIIIIISYKPLSHLNFATGTHNISKITDESVKLEAMNLVVTGPLI